MKFLIHIKQLISRFIDLKMGSYGAIVMAAVVFFINYSGTNELFLSFIAATKQGVYTFFFGGSLFKACEFIATRIKRQTLAVVASFVIPSALTLMLTFALHSLKGTPKPLASTIPTTFIIPATAYWGYNKRKQFNKVQLAIEQE